MNNIIINGTQKQVAWAEKIIEGWIINDGDIQLPKALDATWAIERRYYNIESIKTELQQIQLNHNFTSTPFTSSYPRHSRQQALDALNSLSWDKVAVLDCETSGISKGSEIVELSIVRYHDKKVLFSSLIQPHRWQEYGTSKSTKKAASVNQIRAEQLKDAPQLPKVWDTITNILTSHQIVTYNVAFDGAMLNRSAVAWSLPMPKIYVTCAMLIFQSYMSSPDYYSLQEASDMFRIDRSQYGPTHLSLPDVYATINVINCMRQEVEPDLNIVSKFFKGEMLPVTAEFVTPASFINQLKNMNR